MAAVLNHAGSIDKITAHMEECRSMGLRVLGPDINESQSGFAVNHKGEIRFGFSGLKGVGENAIENIIDERKKHGAFKNVFDLIKRVNLRAVNKRSLECLVYSGAFDCFPEYTRAQYFHQAPGDITSLEKIVKFGQVYQAQQSSASNTLFGESQLPEIDPPKLAPCEPWPLIIQLDHEKEITGMYISGHPLDNFRFELKHYGIVELKDFVEFKSSIKTQEKPNRSFRLAGLVIDAQHRLTKTGKQFGILTIEDYTAKAEFTMWSEDYARYNRYLEKGMIVVVEGEFKPRYNTEEFEFKVMKMHLLETIRPMLTKKITIELSATLLSPEIVDFFQHCKSTFPGNTNLEIKLIDETLGVKVGLSSGFHGIAMTDDLVTFLNQHPEMFVSVALNNG
jgi:DNA polymerase-3 subunit alpha